MINDAVTVGSGNIWIDMGFPPDVAAEKQVKSELALRLHDRIKELGLTQVKAAKLLGISQPAVSRLMSMRFPEFSVYKLTNLLNALGVGTDLVLRPPHRGRKIRPATMRVLEGTAA
jgi:predicted XRE-type DNA-binding protein